MYRLPPHHFQGGVGVGGGKNLEPASAQEAGHGRDYSGLVIDYKYLAIIGQESLLVAGSLLKSSPVFDACQGGIPGKINLSEKIPIKAEKKCPD
jgi:hypothetical protein